MKRFSRYSGLAGLICLILGGLGYAMAPQFKGFYVLPWGAAAIGLILYLVYNPDQIRRFAARRSTRYGAGSVLAVVLFLGIIVFVSILSYRHNTRYDLTADRRFSLAPQTLKVLQGLTTKIKVTGYFQGQGEAINSARDLLDQYAYSSPNFEYELVDPDRYPARAKAAGITRYDITVVEAAGQSEKLSRLSEEQLTNSILRVTRPGKKVLYFVTGHGEKDIAEIGKNGFNQLKTALEDQNYDVRPLLLMQAEDIPSDAAVLVIGGPQKDLLPAENEAIGRYLRGGGKVLFLLDPQLCPDLVEYLAGLGVKVGNDIIVDKMSRLFGGDYLMPLVAQYTQHPITEGFTVASFFPVARSVSVGEQKDPAIKVVPLAQTGTDAWAETDLEQLTDKGTASMTPDHDIPGPIPVAVVGTVSLDGEAQKKPEATPTPEDADKRKKEGKFIVFGDSDFASNSYLNLQGNGDLLLSSLGWLAEEADLVSIRAKEQAGKPLLLSATQARLVFWVPVVVMPLCVLLVGAIVTMRRRMGQ